MGVTSMPLHPRHNQSLTGATSYRKGWFGKLILQVEFLRIKTRLTPPQPGVDRTYEALEWRDAEIEDLRTLDYIVQMDHAKATGQPPPPPPNRFFRG